MQVSSTTKPSQPGRDKKINMISTPLSGDVKHSTVNLDALNDVSTFDVSWCFFMAYLVMVIRTSHAYGRSHLTGLAHLCEPKGEPKKP